MATSLEETLISVWEQVLVDDAKTVMLEDRSSPSGAQVDRDCGKWILNLKATNCAASPDEAKEYDKRRAGITSLVQELELLEKAL